MYIPYTKTPMIIRDKRGGGKSIKTRPTILLGDFPKMGLTVLVANLSDCNLN